MPLDPKLHRPDARLRRPHLPGGEWLRAPGIRTLDTATWGIAGALEIAGEPIAPSGLEIDVLAQGRGVPVGDTLWRPSGSTVQGAGADGTLQLVRDAFVDEQSVVCVLWFRNAGTESVAVDIVPRWGFRDEACAPGWWIARTAPPLDDLRTHVPAGGRGRIVFAAGIGESLESARAQARVWQESPHPHHARRQRVDAWFEENVPRFACDDPWLELLWLHGWNARREGDTASRLPDENDLPRDAFLEQDPDRPRRDAPDWTQWVEERLVGLRRTGERIEIAPDPDARGLGGWCLDGIALDEHRATVAWDDPDHPQDRYDDGCRGYTIHVDGRLRHQSARPCPVAVEVNPQTGACDLVD